MALVSSTGGGAAMLRRIATLAKQGTPSKTESSQAVGRKNLFCAEVVCIVSSHPVLKEWFSSEVYKPKLLQYS